MAIFELNTIGKAWKRSALKKKDGSELSLDYLFSLKAWINGTLSAAWLQNLTILWQEPLEVQFCYLLKNEVRMEGVILFKIWDMCMLNSYR